MAVKSKYLRFPGFTQVGSTLFETSLRKRYRDWTTTPNKKSLAQSDWPINSYTDYLCIGDSDAKNVYATGTIYNPTYNGITRAVKQIGYGSDSYYDGFMYLTNAKPHRTDGDMQNEALIKALGKVSDMKTNLPVMFAERKKTADLILGKANAIYRAMSAFRRGNFKAVAQTLNLSPSTVHKTWLEYKYGWMPLLMETKGSAEFLAQQFSGGRLSRFVVNSKTTDPVRYVQALPGFNRMGFDTNLETITYVTDQLKSCHVKLWLEVSNSALSAAQQSGLTNPALVAWELVPFSFVFDWFCQVGDYLTAVTALHGITVRKAMVSFTEHVDGSSNESFPGYAGFYDIYQSWGLNRKAKCRKYRRSPLTVSASDLHPPVDSPFDSLSRMTSGLALIRGNARGFGSIRL